MRLESQLGLNASADGSGPRMISLARAAAWTDICRPKLIARQQPAASTADDTAQMLQGGPMTVPVKQ